MILNILRKLPYTYSLMIPPPCWVPRRNRGKYLALALVARSTLSQVLQRHMAVMVDQRLPIVARPQLPTSTFNVSDDNTDDTCGSSFDSLAIFQHWCYFAHCNFLKYLINPLASSPSWISNHPVTHCTLLTNMMERFMSLNLSARWRNGVNLSRAMTRGI